MDKLFIDTAAFLALADANDQHHEKAKDFSDTFSARTRLYTSEPVVCETFTNLQYHLGKEAALTFSHALLSGSSGVEIMIPSQEDLVAADRIARKYRDQEFSLVDCLSFVLMERLKIEHTFTFDSHFGIYRFQAKHFKIHPT